MISVIDDPRIKGKCQIFTPNKIVSQMLDLAGYTGAVIGRSILENSCGDGEFLVEIVTRYIASGISSNMEPEDICKGLERDITAYDIDESLINICKSRLDEIAQKYNLTSIKWNIRKQNFLSKDVMGQYDYIVGNPPYIAYSDLPECERNTLRTSFDSCKKGKFDYSYAFIEKSYKMLSPNGKLVYIIPTNIFKNVFADTLRTLIKNDLSSIIDYPQDKVFREVLVSPAIIVVNKGSNLPNLSYSIMRKEKKETHIVPKTSLSTKWIFDAANRVGRRVGNHFKVSNTIATLCNDIFILKDGCIKDGYYVFDNSRIETALLKKATSPKSKRYAKGSNEYIIFPYYYNNAGELLRYSEDEMRQYFPHALAYLQNNKAKLSQRDADSSAKWYEYGRSQALQHIHQRKVIISSVISEDTKAYLLEADEISYAGLFITPTGDVTLEELMTQLNSPAFREYTSHVGVSVSGSSKRITAKDIENFLF